ncbi:uncharacterized protein P174DRAFT_426102 [Aspergillus novofumigatus IBT 16806]|uniref:Uncharacterized protein n=1 Tax=Aspergillus novofumigatus (strain IBT 16806) TaxID=1392255 RepID=A0A2I1BSK7_ASPN1|nr:uncharacterized protein P174DRAFT_426102 [Aspergillus novofumigatus IBT 16806]PKX88336.1 hypothetical protein P174DRAFT_426102 [Aspergillus novofumigatus IBT 16806]
MSGQYLEASTSAREDGGIDVTVKVKQPGLESLLPDNRSADSPRLPEVPLSAVKPLNIVIQIVESGVRVRYSIMVDFTVMVDLIQNTYYYVFEAIPTTQHA